MTGETWLKYLNHVLPRVVNPEHAIVPVTDWYGRHMSEDADSLALELTTSPTVLIGGGSTAEGAVCDQHPHRFIDKRYKDLDVCQREYAKV